MTHAPVALITGAADGIGFAMATRMAQAGCRVVIADLDAATAATKAASLGPEHLGLAMDVTSETAVEDGIAAAIARFGRLDIAVCNAGIGDTHLPSLEQDIASFDQVLRVHLNGTFLVARAAARQMIGQGRGAILTVSSIAGITGLPRRNAYGAAKAGIAAMTKAMACEWGPQHVRVNAIAPGYTRTALVAKLIDAGRIDEAKLRRRTPMGRLADPAEIAEAAWFLCSPAASFITGAVLSVDGGWAAFGDAGDAHI